MAEIKWIKITTDIFDDDKIMLIESMPEGESLLVIWLKILTLAGKTNSNGFLMMSDRIAYTDEMLATIFRRDLKIVRLALNIFEQFEMIEIIDNKILITNWEKHQNADALEKIREQTRKRVAKHRQKLIETNATVTETNVTCNVTANADVTHGNATDIDIDREEDKDNNIVVEEESQKSERFIDVVEANLGRGLVKFEFDMLNDYLYQRHVSTDLFLEAVKIAVANNVRKFNYIARILDNWIDQGIKTPEQAIQAQRDFKAKKANQSLMKSPQSTPEWSNPDYKNETTEEEKQKLEKMKQDMLSRLGGDS
ncbi:phage replisome organizer N-terminal domain-containing protein [Streptococcus sp. S784/96/1]|uniref:phage replisome organizer N-terminal domain-containing protein n=1 Tax=Streptococcus sp. S784/96/1 TaxID=2653499 RepID=UPI00138A1D29|nr:phage replisome organizer N-terminal domain-containing protein [Streptococcus sp. S784/96/1]